MKEKTMGCLLAVLCLVLSGCTAGNNQPVKQLPEVGAAWAASDASIHSAAWRQDMPALWTEAADRAGLEVVHRLIDTIPVYEVHARDARLCPVMFFLHEQDGGKDQFLEEAVTFAQAGFFCVLFDLYGYGERTVPEPVESIETAVKATEDLELLLEYYRLSPWADTDRFILYGHSMGGSAAWHYAAYGKRQPMALAVCSAAADFTGMGDTGAVTDGKSGSPKWEEEVFQRYCQEHNPMDQLDRFAGIPMIIYQGMQDTVIRPELTRAFEERISPKNRNAVFVYDEAGGHNATALFLNRMVPFVTGLLRQENDRMGQQ